MSSYRFVSPGAMARNAIEELFLQQAAAERQQLEDEFRRVQAEAGMRQQAEELAFRKQQEDRVASAQQREFEARAEAEKADRLSRADAAGLSFMNNEAARFAQTARDEAERQATAARDKQKFEYDRQLAILSQNNRQQPEEPLVPVIGDDGQPVLLPRSKAVGRRPASSREQGRPVTSGDAGRVAELDTSLNDVDVLERDLGKTGAGSQLGAALPNVLTEITGLGSDSKQRQAVIDRVKQVIGKALEGGVLRKEDEIKYAKILPTIGDPPDVAKAKISGLREALKQRRQTFVDSLGDANYDVSKYQRNSTSNSLDPLLDELLNGR